MARYCFYCGTELEDNEKCYCRARTRAEAAARSASYSQRNNIYRDQSETGSSAGKSGTSQTTNTDNSFHSAADYSSASAGTTSDKKTKRQDKKDKRKAERERLKAARAEAKRRSQADKERRRQSYQTGTAGADNPYRRRTDTSAGRQARGFGRDLLQLLTRPADAVKAQAQPFWSASHSILLIAASFLGGTHFVFANKWLYSLHFVQGQAAPVTGGLGLYFTGVLISAFLILLYTGILWLLARFLFRQGGLPFMHSLAVGKTSWTYLTLFMLVALPTTMQGGVFGLLLILMGFAFSALIHARSLAVITHLSENQTMNLTLSSILIFTSLFATAMAFFQTILMV